MSLVPHRLDDYHRFYTYPTDCTEEEWAFVAPCLTRPPEGAGQRRRDLRAVFDALRWLMRAGTPRRLPPGDFPPWHAVYDQARLWIAAGMFETGVHDLRAGSRMADGRSPCKSAVILYARALLSTPGSGGRAGSDGVKRRRGSKVHAAIDTFGHRLALPVTPAPEDDRVQLGRLTAAGQQVAGAHVAVAIVDQGDTGNTPADATGKNGIALKVVKRPEAKRGFVPLPPRWVVERSCAWAARFRRPARDDERLPIVLAGLHFVAFATLILGKALAAFNSVRNTL